MKKYSVIGLVLALVLSFNVFSVMGAAEVNAKSLLDDSVLATGTYKITVSGGEGLGFFTINDAEGEVVDYIIIQDNDYGYIYFDNSDVCGYDFQNVNYELISTEDLGVSGYHVFELIEGDRDFDPLLDEDSTVYVKDLSEEELAEMFS